MTQKDLDIIDDLLLRVDQLPDILHLRAPAYNYKFTESDKELLNDTYQKLDDILKEVEAIINVKFPERVNYIRAYNDIDFDPGFGGIKIYTNSRYMIESAWNSGMFDLKDLLKSMRTEVVLRLKDENSQKHTTTPSRTQNFHGNTFINDGPNQGSQSLTDRAIDSPTTQKANVSTATKTKRSWLEVSAWIAAIIGTVIMLIALLN